ncbi:hypothetical protein [Halodesulfurarchaeum formicicum]|uniref:hypothetical protein n=1 Tax=Halodesulfurarchaeum formicicum TaxID=1873524 RepID=UPI0009035590|nr:hypothetical protein [Halodesulfurarchaeum formicicum]
MSQVREEWDDEDIEKVEQQIITELSSGRRLTFEELNDRLEGIPEPMIEDAVRNLLQTQRLAETGDWSYYATKATA